MTNDISVFDFEDATVRSIMRDGEPWFVGKDVCRCLEITDHHQALDRLADDEGGRYTVPTTSGEREIKIVSEPGVYRLVFTSRTDASERFKRWLAHEVLPALRRTGRYETAPAAAPEPRAPIADIELDDLRKAVLILREYRLLYGKAVARRLAARLPIPHFDIPELAVDVADDDIRVFCDERLIRAQGARMSATDLYAAYVQWCHDNEARAHSQTAFGRRLAETGWQKSRQSGRIFYIDVAIADDVIDAEPRPEV